MVFYRAWPPRTAVASSLPVAAKGAKRSRCRAAPRCGIRNAAACSATRLRVYSSLRRRHEFARVRGRGRRIGTAHLTVFTLTARGTQTRVGFSISASIGTAVVRNRLRRRLRGVLDELNLGGSPAREVVIIARPGAGECTYAAIREELRTAVGR